MTLRKEEFIKKYGIEAYQRHLENAKKRRQKNKEKIREQKKKYYQAHAEEIREKSRQYRTLHKDERNQHYRQYYQDNIEHMRERAKQYASQHKEEIKEKNKLYREKHKEEQKVYMHQYRTTKAEEIRKQRKEYKQSKYGRANILAFAYARADKQANRGECTITAQWIIDNIFTSKCHYCGESNYLKLGCDRIDNTLPHTPENVVCCCGKCNVERSTTDFNEFCQKKGVA